MQQNKPKKWVKGKEAANILGLCQASLRKYDAQGKINTMRTPGNCRLYDVNSFGEQEFLGVPKRNICYCRVSTHKQNIDLENQKAYMHNKYPEFEIITDIGSGINFNRPGLNLIIDLAIAGNIGKLVVAYKDRLCRIGYDLIERILTQYSQTEIIVDMQEKKETINEEIASDILQIVTVYSAKIHGMRHYKAL